MLAETRNIRARPEGEPGNAEIPLHEAGRKDGTEIMRQKVRHVGEGSSGLIIER